MNEIIRKGYIGNPAQLVTLRRVTVEEGKARGTQIIEVKNAEGFEVDILPDSGLDLGQCRYLGRNMSWTSKNGPDSPMIFSAGEGAFPHQFPGGLLYTCGLRSAGYANEDAGEYHPLHGRYHSKAAEQVCAEIEEDEIVVRGTIRETMMFGHVLEVKRTIRIPVFGASVKLSDVVTNLTPRDEEIMMIYHCNFGYPLLSEQAKLTLPEERNVIARTPYAEAGLGKECAFTEPDPTVEEQVYFHVMKECRARLENPELGVAMSLSWSGETLPYLSEWKSMGSGDYALGLEPTNSFQMGRHDERENGTLPVLKAFESVRNEVEIAFEKMA